VKSILTKPDETRGQTKAQKEAEAELAGIINVQFALAAPLIFAVIF
jgi:hypothetical protein